MASLSHVLAVVLAVCLMLVLPIEVDTAKRSKPRYKIIEKTYLADTDISLPGLAVATRYPDAIVVSGQENAKIIDVNLMLFEFSHGTPRDLDILLVAPNGRGVLVMGDAGGGAGVSGIRLTLDDSAKRRLPEDAALASGRFRPANYDDGDVTAASEPGGDSLPGEDGAPGGDSAPGSDGAPGTDGQPTDPGDHGESGVPGPPSAGEVDSDAFPAPAPDAGDSESLSAFRGLEPAGEWRLYVRADGPGAGNLGGWGLEITSKKRRPLAS